jgi:hypothetical protein
VSNRPSDLSAREDPRFNREYPAPAADAGDHRPFPRAIFLTLILVTLCLRIMGLVVRHEYNVPPFVGAEAGAIARNIVQGHGFASPYDDPATGVHAPSTHLAPIYPGLLAGMMKLGMSQTDLHYNAVAINLLFAALLPAIVLSIGQAARFPKPVSLLAAMGMCFCPEAFRATGLVWDEAIFVTLSALVVLWMLARLNRTAPPRLRDSSALGLASGFLALLNPAMTLALPFGWLAALRTAGVPWRKVLLHGILLMALTFAGSAPWNVRNWFLLRPPAAVFVRGGFWVTTWSAMHPVERIENPDGTVEFQPLHPWNGTDPMVRTENGVTRQLTEQEFDDWTRHKVLAAARQDPGRMARHIIDQFDSFWLGIAEARRWYKNPWTFFLAQGVPAIGGIVGLYLARRRIAPPVLAVLCGLLLVFPLPYYMADASSRYRHPIDLILYFGCAWAAWLILTRRRRAND